MAKIQKVYESYFGKTDDYAQIKHSFNQLMLSVEHHMLVKRFWVARNAGVFVREVELT